MYLRIDRISALNATEMPQVRRVKKRVKFETGFTGLIRNNQYHTN